MNKRKILITAGRFLSALELVRQLHATGHQVVVVDSDPLQICRFSNAVAASYIVPSPRFQPELFVAELHRIIIEHKIDLLIPAFEEALILSRHRDSLPASCELFCSSFTLLDTLANKWTLFRTLQKLGRDVPKTYLIHDANALEDIQLPGPYIMKRCYSRAKQNLIRVDAGCRPQLPLIQEHNPWIAQEWIEGRRLCTYTVCRHGVVSGHACYPVEWTYDGASCLAFRAIHHPLTLKWVTDFAAETKYHGQLAFDFIETAQGQLFAIDCNPRLTSGIHLFTPGDRIDHAILGTTDTPIHPHQGVTRQIRIAMLLFGWKIGARERGLRRYLQMLTSARDVIFQSNDLVPSLLHPITLSKWLWWSLVSGRSIPALFTADLEWNGENEKAA